MTRPPSCLHRTNAKARVLLAKAGRRATAAAMTMVLGATLPQVALAGPAEIDTDYQGPVAGDIDDGVASGGSARALTVQGQAAFDGGDYLSAAAAWKKLLDILPENAANRHKRQNAVLIALEAYKQAFRRVTVEHSGVSETEAQLLRDALTLCDAYTDEVRRVHGPTGVGTAVVESRVQIEGMLIDAGYTFRERDDGGKDIIDDDNPFPPVRPRGKNGTGLIALGSSSIVLGLGMMPLVIIGARRRQQADADLSGAGDDELMRRDANDRKQSANAMLISGSILMGALTVGGATMLGIGIRRRIHYTAFTPVVGPRYVGLSLQGRF